MHWICLCFSDFLDVKELNLYRLSQAFLSFDALDLQEVIKSLLRRWGVGLEVAEYEQMIVKYETNRDTKIDIAECIMVLEASKW